jgi:peroxiredoxin
MLPSKIWRLFLLSLAALAFAGCGAINEDLPTYEESSIVVEGDVAPDFSATTLAGESLSLSSLRGRVVLLVFFSHTCPDCKSLFDDLSQREAEIEALGVRVLTISRGGSQAEIETYMANNGYTFDVMVDTDREIYRLYATTYVPRCYLIDRGGVVDLATVEYEATHIPHLMERMAQL